ncbi:MAG: hypothetical protein KAR83_02960 [Thermodesulfovibrionales bacterium]|nr:hypothetical protein [Thermodesulfovibrionales bacterium]
MTRLMTIMITLAITMTVAVLIPALTQMETAAAEVREDSSAQNEGSCVDCHRDTTPGITATWEISAHGATNVPCTDCHGTDEQAAHDRKHTVDAERCGACHSGALADHRLGSHSKAMDAPGVKAADCTGCHRVAYSCQSCHSSHSTDPDISSRAQTCGACHNSDAPLTRIWASSAHGPLYAARGEPTCVTCHMEGGSHSTGRGMASSLPADKRVEQRGAMVGICTSCHAPATAIRALEDADRLKSQARALMDRARLTLDTKNQPPPHAFEATDAESRLLAAMATAYKAVRMGAYHQNRAVALRALASMQRTLASIKSRAETLERIKALEMRLDNLAARQAKSAGTDSTEALKQDLRALKDSLIKGEVSEEEYQRDKDALLDGAGL